VALAVAWRSRLPHAASAALDPGWVPTKLASRGAPGRVEDSAAALAHVSTRTDEGGADLASAPYWRAGKPVPLPGRLRDTARCTEIAAACDRLAGLA
jgi:hypothetical protein